MREKIEVIRFTDDNLSGEVWTFYYQASEHTLWLDVYSRLERKTNRHKLRVIGQYSRLARHSDIDVDDAPMPDDVVAEAIARFMNGLKVGRWPRPKY